MKKRGNVPDRQYTEGLGPGGRKNPNGTERWKNPWSRVSKKYTLQNETGNWAGTASQQLSTLLRSLSPKYCEK